jgi:CubicO group peptidase (beta-lactamase class C family)
MNLLRTGFFSAFLYLLSIPGQAGERFPDAAWDHVAADAAGWSSEKLTKAEAWSQAIGSTAVMIVQHGLIVSQWGDTAAKTPLASVRKSLLSALIGLAVEREQIHLDQLIGELGIDDNEPSLSTEEKTATVRDLLEARSGIYHPALYETPRMAALRPPRFSHPPGTFWYYNNWDFNTLGAIYEHAAQSSIYDAFEREIARPIEMEDYRPSDGRYVTGDASVYPAYTFEMSARDLARFGLLYLNGGKWHDRQTVPAKWVEESTRPYSQSGFGPGYGYLWWTGFIGDVMAPVVTLPQGTFFAWGAGGQFAFVIPAYDLVIVHRAPHSPDGGPSLREIGRLLWLVLDAAGLPDIGRDASIEAAGGIHESGAALAHVLPGKTLICCGAATDGPYRMRLNRDGSAAFRRGREATDYDTGSWTLNGDRLCREWQKIEPRRACFAVVGDDGAHVELFDRRGLMVIDARITEE